MYVQQFEGNADSLQKSTCRICKRKMAICSHMKTLEQKYWQQDSLTDETIDGMIIHFRAS